MTRRSEPPARPAAKLDQALTVHVPLDGSPAATTALPVAATIAAILGATLHLVHVAEAPLPRKALLRRLNLRPDELRGRVVDQVTGRPAEEIIRAAAGQRSAFIVTSTHGQTPEGAAPTRRAAGDELGPVARAVLLDAPCPVVLVRPADAAPAGGFRLRRLLLPLDGTPTTAAAIRPALDLAQRSGAAVDVVHVAAPERDGPVEPGTLTTPRYLDQPHHEWPAWRQEFLDRLCRALGYCPTVPLHLSLGHGEPAAAIARLARERQSDLIVLAWRGRLEENRALTLKGVLREAPCPVMVVRVP